MNPKETLLYIPIDFVGSDDRAREFSTKFCYFLISSQVKIQENKYPIHLGLKTTFIKKDRHGWGATMEGEEYFNKGIARLNENGIDYFVENWPSGPTKSMYSTLFDQGAASIGFKAIATGDLDNILPHENLEKVLELDEKTKITNSVLGVGSRNITCETFI